MPIWSLIATMPAPRSPYGDTGLVDLWDEDCAEGMNIGYIDVAFEPGTTDKGRMVSVSGDFYDDEIAARD